ncbi:MAG: SPFH domain-containing protein, partial [Phycisphaerales bacterium]|nr:SPFH domain-containing protein [Phycisphaerales bacterium]
VTRFQACTQGQSTSIMRIDHLAYQRATNIAGFGFLLQLVVATVLLIFGLRSGDTTAEYASWYLYVGLLVWLGMIIIFNQHKLERLEALEEGELVASGSGAESIFDRSGDEVRTAARRLRLMYKWVMPATSILVVLILGALGWIMFTQLSALSDPATRADMRLTDNKGWMVAIGLGFSVICFIFSRYLAGMSALGVWQNLRAGAGVMVGNVIVLMAVVVGTIFRFFEIDQVILVVAWLIPVVMIIVAIEIVLNLILNMYRPRVSGDWPRAAYDSKGLSLLATPDSFVRSINDAVNYQFGFDITSSWGYQLLLRSSAWLIVLGLIVLVALSTLSVVGGREQGLRLRSGAIIQSSDSDVQTSGFFWKLPWPIETTYLVDVTKVQGLELTPVDKGRRQGFLWEDEIKLAPGEQLHPFIVGRSRLGSAELAVDPDAATDAVPETDDFGDDYALVDMSMLMNYRIQSDTDADEPGLIRYLRFGTDDIARRQTMTDRERALRDLALSVTTQFMASRSLDDVLSDQRAEISGELMSRIQSLYDKLNTGVEVVSVNIPMIRPAGKAAIDFQDLPLAVQQRDQLVANAERNRITLYTAIAGDIDQIDDVVTAIDQADDARLDLDRAISEHGLKSPQVEASRKELTKRVVLAEQLLQAGGGTAVSLIQSAERDRWVEIMDKRAQADRVKGQVAAYHAAPQLYRQRSIMQTYVSKLQELRKYIVGISPERMNVNVELRDLASPNTIFEGISTEEEQLP